MSTLNGDTSTAPPTPVTVTLQDLQAGTVPFSALLEAFGPSSLGILLVRSLPPQFPHLRSQVLSNSSHLAHLPPDKLERLTNERAKYLVGWSHGKETLRPGVVDQGKGSFYMGCGFYQGRKTAAEHQASDCTGEEERSLDENDDQKRWADFPEYTAPNLWPSESDIPGFQASAEELITLIIDVAVLVARACDRYALEAIDGYAAGHLERIVKSSRTTKARLLHYFPAEERATANDDEAGAITTAHGADADRDQDDWCATHLDHGCLTGLTSAMFLDESSPSSSTSTSNSPPLPELPYPPSPTSGLYIHSRSSATVKINIPRDCLAFQTGEALERITRGSFKAVPHFVRGVPASATAGRKIARNTLAVFTQPNLGELVDRERGVSFGEFARGVVGRNTA